MNYKNRICVAIALLFIMGNAFGAHKDPTSPYYHNTWCSRRLDFIACLSSNPILYGIAQFLIHHASTSNDTQLHQTIKETIQAFIAFNRSRQLCTNMKLKEMEDLAFEALFLAKTEDDREEILTLCCSKAHNLIPKELPHSGESTQKKTIVFEVKDL